MRDVSSIVILGAGAAGVAAAETLRREGFAGALALIDAEPDPPCERPHLSKGFLAGTLPEERVVLRDEPWFRDRGIELVRGTFATALDAGRRTVQLHTGRQLAFDRLLLATGSQPVQLPLQRPGQPIRYLRSVADGRAIVAAASTAGAAVVVGAGFLGLEMAASLRRRGLDVTVVAPESTPLERTFGTEVGAFIRSLHEARGIRFRLGCTVASVLSDSVMVEGGARVPAGLVVAAVGVRPASDLAEWAGLATGDGILVDHFLETSVEGIYAAGDVARWPDAYTRAGRRCAHWATAQRQGQVAARNMVAADRRLREPFRVVPFFWTRHYDVAIGCIGHASSWDRVAIDGSLAAGNAKVVYWRGDRMLAVAMLGRDRARPIRELELDRPAVPVRSRIARRPVGS